MSAIVQIRDVCKRYQMGDTVVHALRGVSLEIESGDFVAIMGPSGSGKSTLMHLLGLLDVPDEGSYRLEGHEVSRLAEDDLAVMRRETIGFIFQQFNLLPRVPATENVALPLLYSERRLDFSRARGLLERVGLASRAGHKPNELSGGQQQRVAIARSLINRPRIVLADEPTGNLDSESGREILGALKELNSQGITVIVVTHEENVAKHAKRLIRMRDGRVQSDERQGGEPVSGGSAAPPSRRRTGSALVDALELLTTLRLYTRQGLRQLAANKVRTALSMLGILIGVAAVVAMLALGNGAQKAIEAQLASLGSNLLVLRPGAQNVGGVRMDAGSVTRLTLEDAAAIREKIPAVKNSSPTVNGRGQVTYLNKNWSTQILGASPSYAQMHAAEPEVGRFFTDEENAKRNRVAVIGMTLVRELFGQANPIGEWIKVNKVIFQVIGILPEKGSTGFRDQDDVIVIPVLTAMYRVLGRRFVDYIDIEIGDAKDVDSSQEEVQRLVVLRHKIPLSQGDDAFQIRNMSDVKDALAESSRTMSLLLASIAAISLLVGGIGIMNIMLVSVTERTREIGLRKAVGARRWDILAQFLAEAVVVSTVGGIAGIVTGWIITILLSWLAGWVTSISAGSVVLAFFFSASIGVIFGIYPARQASLLNPIDALRYE